MRLVHSASSCCDIATRQSIERLVSFCLVCCGDLARYKEVHNHSTSKCWGATMTCYSAAHMISPDRGSPHNQRAVVASLYEDDLSVVCVLAVQSPPCSQGCALQMYFACRAQICAVPFRSADKMLAQLFHRAQAEFFERMGSPEFKVRGRSSLTRLGLLVLLGLDTNRLVLIFILCAFPCLPLAFLLQELSLLARTISRTFYSDQQMQRLDILPESCCHRQRAVMQWFTARFIHAYGRQIRQRCQQGVRGHILPSPATDSPPLNPHAFVSIARRLVAQRSSSARCHSAAPVHIRRREYCGGLNSFQSLTPRSLQVARLLAVGMITPPMLFKLLCVSLHSMEWCR